MRIKFNLETLEGRKAAWKWLTDQFGTLKPEPDLIVTQNGIPFEDQAEGIRQFKEQALRK